MIPRSELKKKLNILCELQQCNKSKKHNITKHLNNQALDLISDAAYNIVNSNPSRIQKNKLKSVKNYKKTLTYLSNPKNSVENKRKFIIKQEGSGFFSMLASVAIPLLQALIL